MDLLLGCDLLFHLEVRSQPFQESSAAIKANVAGDQTRRNRCVMRENKPLITVNNSPLSDWAEVYHLIRQDLSPEQAANRLSWKAACRSAMKRSTSISMLTNVMAVTCTESIGTQITA